MKTGSALVRQFGQAALTVFLLVTIVFFLMRVVGDPAELLVAPEATGADIDRMRELLGLDQPLLVQYRDYLIGIVTLDFGTSLQQNQPALAIVIRHIPPTLILTGFAMLIGVPLALVLGTTAALRRGSLIDGSVTVLATLGRAIPSFWLGLMLIVLFGVTLKWLPPSGYGSFDQLILPAIALSVILVADVTRLTRSSMVEAFGEDFVTTAYAKGASPSRVTWVHVFRNAMIPVVTIVGLRAASLIAGSIIIETIFAVPGLGWLLIRSIHSFDFPVVQASIIFVGIFVVATSLIVDIAYTFINPRSRDA